jgi:flagellar hook-basal body complex protein FliE
MKIGSMNFTALKPLTSGMGQPNANAAGGKAKAGDMIGDFSEALKKAVNDLSALEEDSGKKVNSLVTGKLENVHDIMIAMEKSKIGLNMAIEVRNKLIEGYKEVMRMQV